MAEFLARASDSGEAALLYRFARREGVPLTILGWGSNVIAPDDGIEGIVLVMKSPAARMRCIGDTRISADAGFGLIDLAKVAAEKGLTGLEPIAGIPGTVGGAVIMNAGTKEGDTASLVEKVEVISPSGRMRSLRGGELSFGYRRSLLQESGWLVLSAVFRLRRGNPAVITRRLKSIWRERQSKFPLDRPSAGSVFKRPPGAFAGRLIEEAGCKDLRVGGAAVSERHANFIINEGGATSADILSLIAEIRRRVYERSGVYLELEQIPLPVRKWNG
jgi:UDP-N-acetylmuramate dehydrogenase